MRIDSPKIFGRTRFCVAICFVAVLAGCSGSDNDAETDPENSASEFVSGEDAIDSSRAVADEEGIAEDAAESPDREIGDEELVEELALAADPEGAPESLLEGDSPLLCARAEVAQNALADGEDDLADEQRNALEVLTVGDAELNGLLVQLQAQENLDDELLEQVLERCATLGFER